EGGKWGDRLGRRSVGGLFFCPLRRAGGERAHRALRAGTGGRVLADAGRWWSGTGQPVLLNAALGGFGGGTALTHRRTEPLARLVVGSALTLTAAALIAWPAHAQEPDKSDTWLHYYGYCADSLNPDEWKRWWRDDHFSIYIILPVIQTYRDNDRVDWNATWAQVNLPAGCHLYTSYDGHDCTPREEAERHRAEQIEVSKRKDENL